MNNIINQILKKTNIIKHSQKFVYIFFLSFLLLGILIVSDYGISTDEPFHRTIGYFWSIQILDKISSNIDLINSLKDKYQTMYWSSEIDAGLYRQYGVFFSLLSVSLEELLNIETNKEAFILRHGFNFFTFFLSSIFFYKIILNRFNNDYYAILITIFYVTTPRIFAESFYNSQDIIFMCFCVFTLYFLLQFLDEFKLKDIILFSLFSALSTSIRVLGVIFFFLFIVFILFNILEKKNFFKNSYIKILSYLVSYPIFVYFFWPFLWDAPIQNFIIAFKSFANYDLNNNIFYLGQYTKATNLPWHYIPTWIFITLPIFILLFFLVGFFKVLKKFVNNYLNLSIQNALWKEKSDLKDFLILAFFLLPLFSVIFLNSTLYGGWRHLYFIYPSIIYFVAVGINYILNMKFYKNLKFLFFLTIIFSVLNNVFILIKFHPYQNVFFNSLVEKKANRLFEIDYWGLGNAETLEYLNNKNSENYSLRVASFTPLHYSVLILKNKNKASAMGTSIKNAKYIFTNHTYDVDPEIFKKYYIDDDYIKFYSLKRGSIIINELYKEKQ